MMLSLFAIPALLLQFEDNRPAMTVAFLMFMATCFAVVVGMIVSMWKTFTKAGQPGWGVLIPFYNVYLFAKIAGRPGWWTILMLIPFIAIVFQAIVSIDVAQNFGKPWPFGFGLLLLPFIFFPILGFGEAVYRSNLRY